MGCDIHIVLEARSHGEEWIGLWSSDRLAGGRPSIAHRDYAFFAEVASVRGSSSKTRYPQNLPRDVSRLAWTEYMRCPTDYHSVSHLSVGEFLDAYKTANPNGRKDFRPEHAAYDLLGISEDYPENTKYRVVFWFDN